MLLILVYQKKLSFLHSHMFPCVWLCITVISITQFQQKPLINEFLINVDKLSFLSPLHTFVHSDSKYPVCKTVGVFAYWGGVLVLVFFGFIFSSTNASLLPLTFFSGYHCLLCCLFRLYFLINSLLLLDNMMS